MKRSDLTLKTLVLGMLLLGGVFGNIPVTFGQVVETEPNHPCDMAQSIGEVTPPFTLNGSLDSTPESPDADFFQFTGTPGSAVRVDLEGQATGKGTLEDPFLGFFDSGCNQISNSSNSGRKFVLTIPSDGIFVLGVTSGSDSDFLGGGAGTYQITILPFAAIGSISGRVIDVVTGEPLPGGEPGTPIGGPDPYTNVSLQRCENNDCSGVAYQQTTSDGRFLFERDDYSASIPRPLEAGSYQIVVNANDYQEGLTGPFEVAEGEDLDIGDIALQPIPVQFSNILPCKNLPPQGGLCRYRVRVTNHLATTPIDGVVWSMVNGAGIGSANGSTTFQANRPKRIRLKPQQSRNIWFHFYVPGKVENGAYLCTVALASLRQGAFFDVVGKDELFCIYKGQNGDSLGQEKAIQEPSSIE